MIADGDGQVNVEVIDGAYGDEQDEGGKFRWLSDEVVIKQSIGKGRYLLALEGYSPVSNILIASSTGCQIRLNIEKGERTILIPVITKDDGENVVIKFEKAHEIEGENRTLCFKARYLGNGEAVKDDETRGNKISLVNGLGLQTGKVSNTYSQGWLRMNARKIEDDQLFISGIMVRPLTDRREHILTANDKPLENIKYGLINSEYNHLGDVAFEGEIGLKEYKREKGIRFSFRPIESSSISTLKYQDWYWPMERNSRELPNLVNMKRIGSENDDWFIFSGASFVEKIDTVTTTCDKNKMHVVDWGCGCGRLTRHLLEEGYGRVTGLDIDQLNILWCKEKLTGGEFKLVKPDPPIDLEGGTIDLIVGHSVMTHLSEIDQFMWLAELSRILKSGGTAILTVMDEYSTSIEKFNDEEYGNLMRDGFLDVGWQNDGVDDVRPGYYRRIFHTTDYIIKYWSNYLEIKGVYPGFSDHQTAIVLTKG